MKASALTQFSYKNETGRSFLSDLQKLTNIDSDNVETLDNVTELILKMAYIMIKEADKNQVVNYEEFLGNIENLYDETAWIEEVLQLACTPLSRQLQAN